MLNRIGKVKKKGSASDRTDDVRVTISEGQKALREVALWAIAVLSVMVMIASIGVSRKQKQFREQLAQYQSGTKI